MVLGVMICYVLHPCFSVLPPSLPDLAGPRGVLLGSNSESSYPWILWHWFWLVQYMCVSYSQPVQRVARGLPVFFRVKSRWVGSQLEFQPSRILGKLEGLWTPGLSPECQPSPLPPRHSMLSVPSAPKPKLPSIKGQSHWPVQQVTLQIRKLRLRAQNSGHLAGLFPLLSSAEFEGQYFLVPRPTAPVGRSEGRLCKLMNGAVP